MSVTINPYTIKRLVTFAYSMKQDEEWVISRVWDELMREERKHMTDELKKEYQSEYQKFHSYIREECSLLGIERRKKELLSDISAATAKSMIEDMVKQGIINIPKNYTIRGTDIGRVVIYFHSPQCKINVPLDYLKARLIRRFPNKRR